MPDVFFGAVLNQNFTVIAEETWDVSGKSVDVWKINYTDAYYKTETELFEEYEYFAEFNGLSMGYIGSYLYAESSVVDI